MFTTLKMKPMSKGKRKVDKAKARAMAEYKKERELILWLKNKNPRETYG